MSNEVETGPKSSPEFPVATDVEKHHVRVAKKSPTAGCEPAADQRQRHRPNPKIYQRLIKRIAEIWLLLRYPAYSPRYVSSGPEQPLVLLRPSRWIQVSSGHGWIFSNKNDISHLSRSNLFRATFKRKIQCVHCTLGVPQDHFLKHNVWELHPHPKSVGFKTEPWNQRWNIIFPRSFVPGKLIMTIQEILGHFSDLLQMLIYLGHNNLTFSQIWADAHHPQSLTCNRGSIEDQESQGVKFSKNSLLYNWPIRFAWELINEQE